MIVKGLNGRSYNLKLKKKRYSNCSKGHDLAREILKKIFPFEEFFEELNLPGTNKLKLDFFIPNYKLAIEVQGIQHTKFIPFFHQHKVNLMKSFQNDNKKKQWCSLNEIKLIELKYGRECEWESIIKNETD